MDYPDINLVQAVLDYFRERNIPYAILNNKKKRFEFTIYLNQKSHYLSIRKRNCVYWKSTLNNINQKTISELMKIGHVEVKDEINTEFRHRAFMDGNETMKHWLENIFSVLGNNR